MPSDALTVAVTTGLGVSVLAGIISGICYILTHGLPNTRTRKPITPWHCNVCGGQFRSIQGILEVEKVVTCAKCKEKVCRVRCSKRDPQRGWICQLCQQPENWFKGFLKSIYLNKDWDNSNMDSDAIDELDEDLMELRKKEREQVRDFIERLVETMLGGNLDDVNVSRIYNDKKYLPITGQSPCSAHASLKQLIQRFAGEAAELPSLKRREDHPAHPEETLSNRTYEDLLSTAIINKVVQANQNEARSSANSSRASAASRRSDNKEYFFGEETLDNKWKNHDSMRDDASSVSSLDDWVRSDSSIGSSKYVDRVSLTIKQHIEEGSSSDEETLDNTSQIQDNSLLHSTDETWHENWYFQKRRLTNSSSPVPVPMLVPNPITEAKVLIGDKEAEELSDIGSDYGDPEEIVPDIKNILVNSKTIIGGKNAIQTVDEDFDALHTSDIKQRKIEEQEEIRTDVNINEQPTEVTEERTDVRNILRNSEPENEHNSLMSVESNTEQDTEYTEQYASLTRTFLKSSMPVPRKPQVAEKYAEKAIEMLENGFKSNDLEIEDPIVKEDTSDSDEEKLKVFKGSYSEREKEKWKHSLVEIPDNPYSPENLERRLSSRSSNGSSSSTFGRDYYIKNAAKSAGAISTSKLLNESEVIEYSSTLNGNENNSEEATTTVTAVPAVVEVEYNEFESIRESPITTPTRLLNHDVSSDSDLSIERVYNLQSGKVFEKKGNIRQEISIKDSYSPEGLKYVPKEFDEDVSSSQTDENHNNTVLANNKITFLRTLTQSDNEDGDKVDSKTVDEETFEPDQAVEQKDEEGEVDVIVPYDENKFKATLEMFKVVSEKPESSKKVEKSDTLIRSPELEVVPVLEVDTLNTNIPEKTPEVKENKIESNLLSPTVITEMPKAFGEIKKIVDNKMNTSDYSEEEILSDNREFSLEYSTDLNEDDISRTESSLDTDPEIIDLKEKRLVKDLLGKFSKSYPNISTTPVKKVEDQISVTTQEAEGTQLTQFIEPTVTEETSAEECENIPSVKNLKQLFDKETSPSHVKKDHTQIYSLTARSLPRQFRQKLKSDDEISLQNEENVGDVNIENEEAVELLPTDITKNMIAFYEHLGNK